MQGMFQRRIVVVLVTAAVWVGIPTMCMAQQQAATLPAGWQQMSATDLAGVIGKLYSSKQLKALSYSDKVALEARAKELFLQIDIAGTALSYQVVNGLHWIARHDLDESVNDRTRNALLARQDDWTNKPYAEAKAKDRLMERVKVSMELRIADGVRWAQAGHDVSEIPKESLGMVRMIFAKPLFIHGSFSVQWDGLLTPSQTGDHTFFISPINVNSADPKTPVKFSMSVSIGGQPVLSANSTNWVSQSNAVTLTANQPVAVSVKLSTEVREIPPGTLHAMLYWQAPGITKSLIPADRFSQADTGTPGLKATYTWTQNGQPQTVSKIDRLIDVAWTSGGTIAVPQDPTAVDKLADSLWDSMSAVNFITYCENAGGAPIAHPFLQHPENNASSLSSARRLAFLDILTNHPTLLDVESPQDAVNMFRSFRLGAADKALDVFSLWATRHADLSCHLSSDPFFERAVRDPFREMARCVTLELPEQAAQLQTQSLQLPDGRCCLPVAYTLAYSFLGRGQINDWIALLDAKLADQSLVGDLRVNWLIARAHAEEIRQLPANSYGPAAARALDGKNFLDQAAQAAQSPPVKIRVAREQAGRLTATQQFQAAKDVFQQLAASVPDDQKPAIALLQQRIDKLAATEADAPAQQKAASDKAYLATLSTRREQAAAKGDADAVSRYDSLINAATAKP